MKFEEIRCEIIPIPTSLLSNLPKFALFFHRFRDDSAPQIDIPCTSTRYWNKAALQCTYCIENELQEELSYLSSNKCFHGAVKHPFKLVSWFDERIEVVQPGGRKWINRLGSSDIYVPLADSIGFSFKVGPALLDDGQIVLRAEDIVVTDPAIQRLNLSSRSLVPVLPDFNRPENFGVTQKVTKAGSFNVLTYNILSDIYLRSGKYFHCPQWALTWEYRRRNLLHEIILYDADIICLQEVQSDHFLDYYKPMLERFGYSVVYKKKTREIYTGNGYITDGCAIFFRNHLFKEVVTYGIEYRRTALPLIERLEPSQRDQASVRLIKDNIALAVILEMMGNASMHAAWSRLCVINTHIYAGKGSPDVKLLQVSDLINEIEKTVDSRMPLFICGDINSIPGSDPYILLTRSEVNPPCGEETIDPMGIYEHLKLHHEMKLESAYRSPFFKSDINIEGQIIKMVDWRRREPSFTSVTLNRRSTLDYIFYTVDSLEVEGLLELPDFDSVGRALPSALWSSDHIALMAKFRIIRPFLG